MLPIRLLTALVLLCSSQVSAQTSNSGKGPRVVKQPVVVPEPAAVTPKAATSVQQTGLVTMDRRWIQTLLTVDGDQMTINIERLRKLQASGDRSLKGMCPEGQEFKDMKIDYAASSEKVADAHLSAISAVIGTKWQLVPVNEYGRDYNPQYIKLARTVDEIRALKQYGTVDQAKMDAALAKQKEIVAEAHRISEAGIRQLVTKMQTVEGSKKSAAIKLPFPVRYSCQVSVAPGTDAGPAASQDAVQ